MLLQMKTIKIRIKMGIYSRSSYRILIIGGSGLGKTNALLNLIKGQNRDNPINKIYLYARLK